MQMSCVAGNVLCCAFYETFGKVYFDLAYTHTNRHVYTTLLIDFCSHTKKTPLFMCAFFMINNTNTLVSFFFTI